MDATNESKKYTIVTNIKPQQMFIKSNYDYCFIYFFTLLESFSKASFLFFYQYQYEFHFVLLNAYKLFPTFPCCLNYTLSL